MLSRLLTACLVVYVCAAVCSLSTADAQGGRSRRSARPESVEPESVKPATAALPEAWASALNARSIGPANMSGRITALAVYEADPCIWWAATASGGLLKTTNNGITFEHQFDHEATVSIGDVQVSQTDPDLVWVGTGESNPRNSVSWGNGVYRSTDGGATWKHMGLEGTFQTGRIAIHPVDHNVVYVGALGRLWGPNEERGLFKTTDGGETWSKILYVDGNTGVVDVNLDPSNPDTLIVATYERERDGFDTNDPSKRWGPGSGIWKSTDAGATFRRLTDGLPSAELGRVDVEYYRADPSVIYALVESSKIGQEPENAAYFGTRGQDADVGARLTEVIEDGPAEAGGLQVDDIVIGIEGETVQSYDDLVAKVRRHVAGETIEIEVSRERESIKLEVTLTVRPDTEEDKPEPPAESDDVVAGAEAAAETAESETAAAEEAAAPSTEAVEPADPESASTEAGAGQEADSGGPAEPEEEEEEEAERPSPFRTGLGGQVANVQDQQGPDGHEYGGLYKSTDGGETWTRINSLNPRPMYFSQLRVDPSDDQHIYILGISLHRSKDGGEEFTSDGARGGVHVDHHALWIDPNDGRHVILGNDGGAYVTYDRLEQWDHLNHMAIGQFYHVAVGPRPNYWVYGGLQDNGSWGGPSRVRDGSGARNEDWISIGGGDGFLCLVDPTDPDLVYFESQNGSLGRRNLRTGERGSMRPRGERGTRLRWNWRTPFILSNHNSGIYYTAANHVFRSWLQGDDLQRISPEITNTDRGSATALAESPFDAEVLYVGSDDGALWRTKDGGGDWVSLFAEKPAPEEPRRRRPPIEASAPASAGMETGAEETAAEETAAEETAAEETAAEETGLEQTGSEETAAEPGDDEIAEAVLVGNWVIDMGGGGSSQQEGSSTSRRGRRGGGGSQGGFTMAFELKLGEDGELTGSMDSFGGARDLSRSSFDPADQSLRLTFGDTVIEGKLEGDKISGELDFSGRFQREFTAARSVEGEEKKRDDGYDWKTLSELVAVPLYVSAIEPSGFEEGRVYLALDGHRSNDDAPHVFVSEDHGDTWRSLNGNLPASCGSTRVIREDLQNSDLLYLGTEFGAWVTIDRGATWTRLDENLPTVAVHEFAQHLTNGEVVLATHGRSLWVVDVAPLRSMSAEAVAASAQLYPPNQTTYWRTEPSTGGTLRQFRGENPPTGAEIYYSLGEDADRVRLRVKDLAGETLAELTTSTDAGLHRASWNLRPVSEDTPQGGGGRRRFGRGGPRVAPGTYQVELRVGGETITQPLVVQGDPEYPEAVLWGEEYEEQLELEELLQGEDEEEEARPEVDVL